MTDLAALREVTEELVRSTGSPKLRYLVNWMASKIDLGKVSSQQTLIRWLEKTIEEESIRLNVPEHHYQKRFRGLIKFIRDRRLAWEGLVVPYQSAIASEMMAEFTHNLSRAETSEELREYLQELKQTELPPAVQGIYAPQKNELVRKYTRILKALENALTVAMKYSTEDLTRYTDQQILRLYKRLRRVVREIHKLPGSKDVVAPLSLALKRVAGEYAKRVRELVRKTIEKRLRKRRYE